MIVEKSLSDFLTCMYFEGSSYIYTISRIIILSLLSARLFNCIFFKLWHHGIYIYIYAYFFMVFFLKS